MDKVINFITTPIVYHGSGAIKTLNDEIKKYSATRIGIITDPGIVSSGIYDTIADEVNGEVFSFQDVEPEPPATLVQKCTDYLREKKCELIIGLGGGSALDTAKMVAAMVNNTGAVTDYYGVNKIPNAGVPVIAIPTTAGTGSEASPAAIFIDDTDNTKKGVRCDHMIPKVAILDPDLTVSLPQKITASTGMDALTHAIECYTSNRANLMSDMVTERSIELIAEHLPVAFSNGLNLEARYGMLMGSYLGGISLAIANVGAVHGLAQTIGGKFKVAHGVANAMLLPYVMEWNRISCQKKYAKVAQLMGEDISMLSLNEASKLAVERVRELTQDLNIPQHLRELDIPKDELDGIAQRCLTSQARVLALNPRVLDVNDLRAILEDAY